MSRTFLNGWSQRAPPAFQVPGSKVLFEIWNLEFVWDFEFRILNFR